MEMAASQVAVAEFDGPPARSLDDFLHRLSIADRRQLEGGGSNATIYGFDRGGSGYVVKFVRTGTELVDGHDAVSLRRKADQLQLLRETCPRLSSRFVQPAAVYAGEDGCAIVMPRIDGRPLLELLAGVDEPDGFFGVLGDVLTELIDHGYLTSSVPARSGTFAAVHLDRVERRLGVVRANIDPVFLDGAVINGVRCPSVEDVLARLRSSPELLAALDPPRLHFPVHGDLNADNVFLRRRGAAGDLDFSVLDPRGTVEHWDAMYDMGKLLFSLSGLHAGMSAGFTVHRRAGGVEVDVRFGQTAAFEAAADRFQDFLAGLPAFRRLTEGDPHWRLRLQMSTAMHMLAEVACRFSDSKVRKIGSSSGHGVQQELAVGLYSMGIVTLTRFLEAVGTAAGGSGVVRPSWRPKGLT